MTARKQGQDTQPEFATRRYVDEQLLYKSDRSVFDTHEENTDIHVTDASRSVWDAKVDSGHLTEYVTRGELDTALKGKVDADESGAVAPGRTPPPTGDQVRQALGTDPAAPAGRVFTQRGVFSDISGMAADPSLSNLTEAGRKKLFSGEYSDLKNAPKIPSKTSELDNDAGFTDQAAVTARLQSYTPEAAFTAHTTDGGLHVTPAEKQAWNEKAGPADLAGYARASDVESSLGTKADAVTVEKHVSDQGLHLTPARIAAWDAKQPAIGPGGHIDAEYIDGLPEVPSRTSQLSNDSGFMDRGQVTKITDTLASKAALQKHVGAPDLHLTPERIEEWNSKPSAETLSLYVKTSELPDMIKSKADLRNGRVPKTQLPELTKQDIDSKIGAYSAGDASLVYNQKGEFVSVSGVVTSGADKNLGNLSDKGNARFAAKADKAALDDHTTDKDIHVTALDKERWNNKADSGELAGFVSQEDLTTGLAKKADAAALNNHMESTAVHLQPGDRDKWDAKLAPEALNSYYTKDAVNGLLDGKAGLDPSGTVQGKLSKTQVDTAISASSEGDAEHVYSQKGTWVKLPKTVSMTAANVTVADSSTFPEANVEAALAQLNTGLGEKLDTPLEGDTIPDRYIPAPSTSDVQTALDITPGQGSGNVLHQDGSWKPLPSSAVPKAADVTIQDAGDHYIAANVEGALQEAAAAVEKKLDTPEPGQKINAAYIPDPDPGKVQAAIGISSTGPSNEVLRKNGTWQAIPDTAVPTTAQVPASGLETEYPGDATLNDVLKTVDSRLDGIPQQAQADWNETVSSDPSYIQNKPVLITQQNIDSSISAHNSAESAHSAQFAKKLDTADMGKYKTEAAVDAALAKKANLDPSGTVQGKLSKTQVDTAVGASSAGNASLVYNQKGNWLALQASQVSTAAGKTVEAALKDITQAAAAGAQALATHTGDSEIHVSAQNRKDWNAKLDASALTPYARTDTVNTVLKAKADLVGGSIPAGQIQTLNRAPVQTALGFQPDNEQYTYRFINGRGSFMTMNDSIIWVAEGYLPGEPETTLNLALAKIGEQKADNSLLQTSYYTRAQSDDRYAQLRASVQSLDTPNVSVSAGAYIEWKARQSAAAKSLTLTFSWEDAGSIKTGSALLILHLDKGGSVTFPAGTRLLGDELTAPGDYRVSIIHDALDDTAVVMKK